MFDPLHKWLGIPSAEQPPTDYRLLGLAKYEDDADVIDSAADRVLTFLHDFTGGEHGELAEQLSNQVSAARLRLLNPARKAAYDAELRAFEDSQQAPQAVDSTSIDAVLQIPPRPPRESDAAAVENEQGAQDSSHPPGRAATAPAPPIRTGNRQAKSKRPRWRLFWLITGMPGMIALVYLVFALSTGRLEFDQQKLQRLGLATDETPEESTEPAEEPSSPTQPSTANVPAASQDSETTPPSLPRQPDSDSRRRPLSPGSDDRDDSIANSDPPQSVGETDDTSATPWTPSSLPFTPRSRISDVDKPPVPPADTIEQKMSIVRELYEDAYRNASDSEQRIEVADKMRRAAEKMNDDPEGKFALCRVARDIYVGEDDFVDAIETIELMDRSFAGIDEISLSREVLSSVGKTSSRAGEFAAQCKRLAAICIPQARFDDALAIMDLIRENGIRLRAFQYESFKMLKFHLEYAKELFDQYQSAALKLEQDPTDPEAELAAGKYLALIEGRWEDALPRLAKGSDPLYREAAALEIGFDSNEATALEVADAWYEVIRSTRSVFGAAPLAKHAVWYYQDVMLKNSGLEKEKAAQRITTLNRRIAEGTAHLPSSSENGAESRYSAGTRLLDSQTFDSPDPDDFATINNDTVRIGMGRQSSGHGETAAGFELDNVGTITVRGTASQPAMAASPFVAVGFMIDYFGANGYRSRVFLDIGNTRPQAFSNHPPWGSAAMPSRQFRLPPDSTYTLDLRRWAPPDWNGRCWFSVYMRDAGPQRTLMASVSWDPPASVDRGE
ncbi:hypothetical protein FYK55_09125 [Roseiconus nitratireducens]|uniref:Uncharacterized protein n=1 Tax=Roseiconus nitratireducens TaxID=2605748 RepID=A0A5M6DAC0_9BACT|nr:hypothetical protein [Roseiconus nitratireducens]KAA5544481.1 hypothetical protein FYK55_09125 [Roseiconus nitratireducens]